MAVSRIYTPENRLEYEIGKYKFIVEVGGSRLDEQKKDDSEFSLNSILFMNLNLNLRLLSRSRPKELSYLLDNSKNIFYMTAHGIEFDTNSSINEEWVYENASNNYFFLEDKLLKEETDGADGALLVVCNPNKIKLKHAKIPVIYPNNIISGSTIFESMVSNFTPKSDSPDTLVSFLNDLFDKRKEVYKMSKSVYDILMKEGDINLLKHVESAYK